MGRTLVHTRAGAAEGETETSVGLQGVAIAVVLLPTTYFFLPRTLSSVVMYRMVERTIGSEGVHEEERGGSPGSGPTPVKSKDVGGGVCVGGGEMRGERINSA